MRRGNRGRDLYFKSVRESRGEGEVWLQRVTKTSSRYGERNRSFGFPIARRFNRRVDDRTTSCRVSSHPCPASILIGARAQSCTNRKPTSSGDDMSLAP